MSSRNIRLDSTTMLEVAQLTGIPQYELEVRLSQAREKGNALYFTIDVMWTAAEVGDPLIPIRYSREEQGM